MSKKAIASNKYYGAFFLLLFLLVFVNRRLGVLLFLQRLSAVANEDL
jgi:hypothetical protein